MSDLAFLSSDDEVELDKASASALASASASDSGKIVEEQNLIVNEEDEDESDEEFGNDFEFGGLLVSFCLILFWFTLNWVQFYVYCMDLILLTHPHHIHIISTSYPYPHPHHMCREKTEKTTPSPTC
jgi:hypothetical protein